MSQNHKSPYHIEVEVKPSNSFMPRILPDLVSYHSFWFLHRARHTMQYFFTSREKHHFHLVAVSQLPLIAAFASISVVVNIVMYWHPSNLLDIRVWDQTFFQSAWLTFGGVLFSWFLVVTMESGHGFHTINVRKNLVYGMLLFIVSEIMFFFAFFWAFFHLSLSPSMAVGAVWPPESVQSLDVWGLPLVNTILLLSSGVTITLAHRTLLQATNYMWVEKFAKHLLVTIILGVIFLCCQGIEYKYGVIFRWKENVFGSTFFSTTGFHGFHVTLGTLFLLFCFLRAVITSSRFWKGKKDSLGYAFLEYYFEKRGKRGKRSRKLQRELKRAIFIGYIHRFWKRGIKWEWQQLLGEFAFTKDQHFGFEASAWYWHFVDVVWIFLFITVYWWGS